MISILIAVLIVCLVLYCTRLLLSAFSIGDSARTVIFVVVLLLCVLWMFGGGPVLPGIRIN